MNTGLFKRNIVYRVRTINKKNVLFGENQCFELNELALLIWNNLDGENSIDDLINMIAEEYDADKSDIKKDIEEFINEMVESNVILECK